MIWPSTHVSIFSTEVTYIFEKKESLRFGSDPSCAKAEKITESYKLDGVDI